MAESQAIKFVKHTSIYAAGNIARQLTGFIMLPIYTRFLTPADYGVVGLLIFTLGLIEIIFGARMIAAIPKFYHEAKDETGRSLMISTAWLLTVSVSLVASFAMMTMSEDISWLLFDTNTFTLEVTLFSINLVTMGMENYGLTYIRVREKPVFYVSMGIAKLVVQLVANILLVVYFRMGVLGVVISSVVSSSLFAIILSTYMLLQTRIHFSKHMAKELIVFSWPLWVAAFAGLYIGSANRIFLKEFVSLEAVGLFALAGKLSQVLMVMIWGPIAQYWQVECFKHHIPGQPTPDIYRNMHKVISILLISGALAIVLFSKPVIIIMADPAFHDAFRVVVWLVFADFFTCMTMYSNFSFHLMSQTKVIRNNNYLIAVLLTIYYFILIPIFGFVGAAIAIMLARLSQFLLVWRTSKKIYDMKLDMQALVSLSVFSFSVAIICDMIVIPSLLYEILFRSIVFLLSMVFLVYFIKRDKVLYKLGMDVIGHLPLVRRLAVRD